ncbi:MAG: hypothetical protein ACPIOQ_24815 [Promethearchaeia archaeon]
MNVSTISRGHACFFTDRKQCQTFLKQLVNHRQEKFPLTRSPCALAFTAEYRIVLSRRTGGKRMKSKEMTSVSPAEQKKRMIMP